MALRKAEEVDRNAIIRLSHSLAHAKPVSRWPSTYSEEERVFALRPSTSSDNERYASLRRRNVHCQGRSC